MKNINKISITIFLIFIVFVVMLNSAFAAYKASPIPDAIEMNVTMINQEPDPAEPGALVDVRFMFENIGGRAAKDVVVELLPKYPFSFYSGTAIKNIGTIQSRQTGDEGVIVKFKLKIDKDAVEGDNELELRYKVGDSGWIKLDPFKISIQSHDAILAVQSYSLIPEKIRPGATSKLTIRLKNMADSLLKDIKIKLNLDNVPVAPVKISNEKTIYNLDSKKELDVTFNLIAEPDAASKVYKIPLLIDYSDELGKKYSKNSTLGIIIGDTPDLSVYIDSTTIYQAAKKGNIVVKFVNKGLTDIKFLNVKVKASNEVILLSPKEEYIGKIDSDDYETIELKMYVKPTNKNKIIIPLVIEYQDSNNEGYEEEINLDLRLYSTSEAKKLELVKQNKFIGILIFIIIIIAGFFLYKRHKRKRIKS
jgi:hypothetical protein